jgi:primosomal protein N' (replication factor Y)
LARPKAHIVITADHALTAVQALVRWDAGWFATRELADRKATGLPPDSRAAVIKGETNDVLAVIAAVESELNVRILGPTDGQAIILTDRKSGSSLADLLHTVTASRSAKAALGVVHCHLDPRDITQIQP